MNEYNGVLFKILLGGLQIILLCLIVSLLINIFNKNNFKKIISKNNLKKNKVRTSVINMIEDLDIKITLFNYNLFTYLGFVIISFMLCAIFYILSYKYLNLIIPSLLVGVIFSCIPYIVLKILIRNKEKKILNIFPTYLVNLKTYTRVDNNIIKAINQTKASKPLKKYIEMFNILIAKGTSIYDSFENLKKNINIDKISEFITLLQHCSINGGDVTNILDKYSKIQMKINLKNQKEKQNIYTSKASLITLLILDIYILLTFTLGDSNNFNIITTTFIGQVILNINIISLIIIGYLYYKINEV